MEFSDEELYNILRIQAIKFKNSFYTVEELINVGYLGYRKALEKHDKEKSCLKTYINIRIRGEILDYMRNNTIGKRNPKNYVSIDEINDLIANGRINESGIPCLHEVEDKLTYQYVRDVMAIKNLTIAMLTLSDKELFVLKEYYWKDKKMSEIAKEAGVSEAYISLIASDARRKLKAFLN